VALVGRVATTVRWRRLVAGIDERVAALEGRMEGQSEVTDDLRAAVADLGRRMDRGFDQMNQRFAQLDHRFVQLEERFDKRLVSLEPRFTSIDHRLTQIDQRFTQIDLRFTALEACMNQRFDQIDRRFLHLEDKMSRQFLWLAGIQVTTVLAFMAALVTILTVR
jgi:uncharacterized coiled-coil protein SlyX